MDYETSLLQSIVRGAGCMSFRFAKPEGYAYQGGQYFFLRLGDKLMKPFSYSNSPTEDGYVELTTKMSESEYKKRLASLRPGDKVRLTGPMGRFTYGGQRKLALLAGGIGITPFRSMIKYLSDAKADCDIVLMWGVNTMEDAIFKADFDGMASVNNKLKVAYVPDNPPQGWVGRSGFIGKDHILSEIPDYPDRIFYVCGPPKMVEAMGAMLAEMGVKKEKALVEEFSGY